MSTLSMRAYARHRSVTLAAVQKAVESGRISIQPDGGIDPELADCQWEENTRSIPSCIVKGAQVREDGSSGGASRYAAARAEREHYAALLARAEYEERIGNLVSKDEVETTTFQMFRQFRDRMLLLPDRISAVIAAETSAAVVHEILAGEVRTALEDFAGQDGLPPSG